MAYPTSRHMSKVWNLIKFDSDSLELYENVPTQEEKKEGREREREEKEEGRRRNGRAGRGENKTSQCRHTTKAHVLLFLLVLGNYNSQGMQVGRKGMGQSWECVRQAAFRFLHLRDDPWVAALKREAMDKDKAALSRSKPITRSPHLWVLYSFQGAGVFLLGSQYVKIGSGQPSLSV